MKIQREIIQKGMQKYMTKVMYKRVARICTAELRMIKLQEEWIK